MNDLHLTRSPFILLIREASLPRCQPKGIYMAKKKFHLLKIRHFDHLSHPLVFGYLAVDFGILGNPRQACSLRLLFILPQKRNIFRQFAGQSKFRTQLF